MSNSAGASDSKSETPMKVNQDDSQGFLADLDYSNLLTAHAVSFPDSDAIDKYRGVQQNVRLWQIWEAASTEDQVNSKTKSKALPTDSSSKSIVARNTYRSKVVGVLRGKSNWLAQTASQEGSKILKVSRSKAGGAILQTLSAMLPSLFSDVIVVLKPTVQGHLQDAQSNSQHLFTLVSHSYDSVAARYLTTIQELAFNIDVPGGKDVGDNVEINVKCLLTNFNFIHSLWDGQKSGIKAPMIEAGEAIIKDCTLHLAATSS